MTNATLWFSQIQFFLSLGFMSLFLLIELGLAWVLLFFKLAAHRSGQAGWTLAYRFWVRVFALAAILTLASSMPVLIQLGSLWPALMDKIGNLAGPLLAGAILTTFIFKSCFLGAMLFGQRRLSERLHTMVVLMVAVGATLAALWGVALLSWMQSPAGALLVNGQYLVTDWYEAVFNPMLGWLCGLLGASAALTVAFLMLGVVAGQTLLHPPGDSERLAFRCALSVAVAGVVALGIAVAGYGLTVARHQPAKAAATAAYWRTGEQPDLVLFAWPDTAQGRNRAALTWRHAGGKWLGRDAQDRRLGLDSFSGMAPPVPLTFWSFRALLGVAGLMGLAAWLTYLRLRKRQFDPAGLPPWWRRLLAGMAFSGWLLGLAGLCHVLFGLAPYAVNHTITLSEIAGTATPEALAGGIAAHLLVYGVLMLGFFQLLRHNARHGVVPVARRRGRA